MTKTMRVRVELVLTVDIQSWVDEYGVEPAEVRNDVKRYVRGSLQDHFDSIGTVVDVESAS